MKECIKRDAFVRENGEGSVKHWEIRVPKLLVWLWREGGKTRANILNCYTKEALSYQKNSGLLNTPIHLSPSTSLTVGQWQAWPLGELDNKFQIPAVGLSGVLLPSARVILMIAPWSFIEKKEHLKFSHRFVFIEVVPVHLWSKLPFL